MALPWVRLDTQFPQNPKVIALTEDKAWRAIAAYLCSLSFCGSQGYDGYIPAGALPFIHATKKEARQLVDVGLWQESGSGGYQIPDWTEYQPTTEEHQKRSNRMKALAERRWAKDASRNA